MDEKFSQLTEQMTHIHFTFHARVDVLEDMVKKIQAELTSSWAAASSSTVPVQQEPLVETQQDTIKAAGSDQEEDDQVATLALEKDDQATTTALEEIDHAAASDQAKTA
ncbi:uncharacterized protein LOC116117302 [Pistacia vera]|uniref:uncharacterized protein LOC116117302 n=1 Tax=Pistacia vera TaxID=55513 RepID=UPI001262F4C3|nr:uncharacterized protein LOC116117302 [Pistacia vera]